MLETVRAAYRFGLNVAAKVVVKRDFTRAAMAAFTQEKHTCSNSRTPSGAAITTVKDLAQ